MASPNQDGFQAILDGYKQHCEEEEKAMADALGVHAEANNTLTHANQLEQEARGKKDEAKDEDA